MPFRVFLVSSAILFAGCREQDSTSSPEAVAGDESASTETQASAGEEIAELRREIDADKQGIGDIDAFVQMERAKLEEDPEYDKSFMLEALDEQEQLKEAIKTGEARLEELTGPQD